ncbi:MAG: helix-turn-helix transcriptional regulator [Treponema sp.]|nr:helix-turn-helix transcriptional regulator [Treponema sp.]
MPIIIAEFILAIIRFLAFGIVFYILHHPKTLLRRILSICLMAIIYPLCRILFFASGGNIAVSVVCYTILLLTLAFICEDNDLIRPVISALYVNGMLQLINYILSCYMYAFSGTLPVSFSFWSYFWKTIEGLIFLLWSLFYYRIARNITAKTPLSFSLFTIFTPLIGLAIIAASTKATHSMLEQDVNVFLYGGLFGTLIVVLNMCIFYLYTKLSVTHSSLVLASELGNTPPVWTQENGLSIEFIKKYEITQREKEVVEEMLKGRTDKEISLQLNIAVNTVQVHLKRIYRKTGASGRFALSALVRNS